MITTTVCIDTLASNGRAQDCCESRPFRVVVEAGPKKEDVLISLQWGGERMRLNFHTLGLIQRALEAAKYA